MHWLNMLSRIFRYTLLIVGVIAVAAVILSILIIALLAFWTGGGALINLVMQGDAGARWSALSVREVWIGSGCLTVTAVFLAWVGLESLLDDMYPDW